MRAFAVNAVISKTTTEIVRGGMRSNETELSHRWRRRALQTQKPVS